jgi:uncharacterized protein YndB with AHSA1/START domain
MATNSGKTKVTLPTDQQILITRDFAAPRHLVYRAWTTPDLVRRWWGGQRGEMRVVDIDLRVGGTWRYVLVAHGGLEVAFHGTYREIVSNERIVATEIFEMPDTPEPADDQAPLNVVSFTESGGRTQVSLLVQCPTQELRDIIVNSGMELGLQEQMDELEALLALLL